MRHSFLITILLLITGYVALNAQVTNDNLINYYVELDRIKWNINNDGDAEEPAWRWFWRKNQAYSITCDNTNYSQGTWCYEQTVEHNNWLYPHKEMIKGTNAPDTDELAFSVFGHENDVGSDCSYDNIVFDADNDAGCLSDEVLVKGFAKRSEWGYKSYNYDTDSWRFGAIYRYSRGNTRDQALTFGRVADGRTLTHDNSTYSIGNADGSINTDLSYTNTYKNADEYSTPAPDVFYSFNIDSPMAMRISTNYSFTNFDTRIYILDNDNKVLDENDDINSDNRKSEIRIDLCPGNYKIVVEGYNSNKGTFRLSVGGTKTNLLTAGSIEAATEVCEGARIPKITSTQAANTPCRELRTGDYQWQKWDGANWQPIVGATSEEYTPSGTMENQTIYFFRLAKDGYGNEIGTDFVTIRPAQPELNIGEISFTAADFSSSSILLTGETLNVSIAGGNSPGFFEVFENANATPSPARILWEKRELNGQSWTPWGKIEGATGQNYTIPALEKTTEFRKTVASACDNQQVESRLSSGVLHVDVLPADGTISGRVTSRLGTGVDGVSVKVERIDYVEGGTDANGMKTAITNSDGEYKIEGLFYGTESAEFKVTPSREEHEFDPMEQIVELSSTFKARTANFTDTTVFVVSGNIYQDYNGDTCPVAGAKVDLIFNGLVLNPNDTILAVTDEMGNYRINVQNPGIYSLRPKLQGHTFAPANQTINVQESQTDVNFEDNTKMTLQGFVRASCDTYMGISTVTLTDEETCFTITGLTNSEGFYQINNIPARKYNAQITDFTPIEGFDKLTVLGFFNQTKQIDLSMESKNQDFIYQRRPTIEVTGMPEAPCSDFNFPVLEQNESTTLSIRIVEENSTCPVDTGTIAITNQIGDMGDEPITLQFKGGTYEYELKAGAPNIINPYLKDITIVAIDTFERQASYNQAALVTGGRPREQNYSTQSPQLPMHILRDPPGDQSYSFLEEETTTELATRFYSAKADASNKWGNVRVGLAFDVEVVGISTGTAFWGDVGGAYKVNATNSSATETVISMTNSERFETNAESTTFIKGSEGDLFVGAAMAFQYAITDEVLFDENTCQVLFDKNLVIANEGLESEFMFTEQHIKESVIPELQMLRDDETTSEAQIADYDNQILVWEQMLQRNDELKAQSKFEELIQFSGNTSKTRSTTATTTDISTIEFGMEIDTEVALEMGFEYAGSGLKGGLITNFKMETGGDTTRTNVRSLTTGYHLEDDDPLDEFTVEVRTDPVYKTPVFVTKGGQSSCPVEPNTNAREAVKLRADNPIQAGIPADGTATFTLFAGNISETDEDRVYLLALNQVSNTGGAAVTINGSPYTVPVELNTVGASSEVPVVVTVTRGANSPIYTYEGLEFILYSNCEDFEVASSVDLTVFFQSPCSDITLTEPQDGFVLGQSNNDEMRLRMKDYDVNNLDQVTVEYSEAGRSSWKTAVVLAASDLVDSEFGTEVTWNIQNLDDGEYDVRLKLACGTGTTYSSRIRGLVDRSAPQVLGTPAPQDDNFVVNDEISVNFNEVLGCNMLSAANVQLKRVLHDETINAQLTCFENKLIITPNIDITAFNAEPIEVQLTDISDQYGNAMSEAVTWTFNVGGDLNSMDFDGDGVPDAIDKCPGFNDALDNDGDGIPNACDLCPEKANAGLAFDGVDDKAIAEGLSESFDSLNLHTIEAWVYIDSFPAFDWKPILTLGDTDGIENEWVLTPYGNLEMGAFLLGQVIYPKVDAGQWMHLATVYNGSHLTLYINGIKHSSIVATYEFDLNTLQIGSATFTESTFNGKLDEVRIWNTARSQSEIGQFMNKELAGDEAGLVTYYNMNEGTANADNSSVEANIQDITANAYDATMSNFAQTGNKSNWVIGTPILEYDADGDGEGEYCAPAPTQNLTGFSSDENTDAQIVETRHSALSNSQYLEVGLSPNPTREGTTIELQVSESTAVSVEVYNSTGVLMQRVLQHENLSAGKHQQAISTSDFQAGMYFVLVRTAAEQLTSKLIVVE